MKQQLNQLVARSLGLANAAHGSKTKPTDVGGEGSDNRDEDGASPQIAVTPVLARLATRAERPPNSPLLLRPDTSRR